VIGKRVVLRGDVIKLAADSFTGRTLRIATNPPRIFAELLSL